jgi:hypothetical protein
MAYDPRLAQRVRERLSEEVGLHEREMFGGIAFMLDGNMALGIVGDDLIVRVGAEETERALSRPHARPFDMTGRAMRGWVMIAGEGLAEDEALSEWVQWGRSFALSLPPK